MPQVSDKLDGFAERIVDMMMPFQKRWCYLPGSNGSASLKIILPLLCPQLSYDQLTIQSGDMAMLAYLQLIQMDEQDKKVQLAEDLKNYCKQDTYALVKIHEALRQLE